MRWQRTRRIENGDQTVVGVNSYVESAESPLGGTDNIMVVDPAVEAELIADVNAWRTSRDNARVETALAHLRSAAETDENIMEASIELAIAGGTTGEWSQVLRDVFGEFRAPTGVAAAVGRRTNALAAVAEYVRTIPGGPPRFLVAKPGLDGHSSGAEQIAVAARDAGMEVSQVVSNLSGPIDLHEAAALCTERGFFNTGFCVQPAPCRATCNCRRCNASNAGSLLANLCTTRT